MAPATGVSVFQVPAVSERSRLVVGVGASAGGLDAFKAFFHEMPSDTGMSFVLVQHLAPTHESTLVAIISSYTAMPVNPVADGMAIQPSQIYVIPPDAILTIKHGILHLTRPAPPAARRTSINTFLLSLAEDQGENAVGIILSGFGSDGALGIAAIKENGGLTLSQADFDHHAKLGMPQSAASAGFVDHVLPVEGMATALLNYQSHRTIFDATTGPDGIRIDLPSHLVTICAVLNGRLGRDFSQYKAGTLMRRIQRRMHVLQLEDVTAYIEQLRNQPGEAELLFHEFLISVTRFFRDNDAFEVLATQVIPGLLATPRSADPIRVWVAGCATGEEAYSIAILLKEELARSELRRPVQIFATDLDERAIELARAGLYPETIASDLTPLRLAMNFVKEDGGWRVTKDIREMCLFSRHDLIKEPPFSRLDLVTCRNLLIYFEPQLQYRVLATFHYALRPGGCLMLGPSEGVAMQPRLFEPIDKRQRIFIRQDVGTQLAIFPLSYPVKNPALAHRNSPAPGDDIDRRAARLIARYAPAFLVVNRQHDILRFSGQTAKYLAPASGVASLNLFNLLHPDLRAAVRAALKEAAATGQRVLHDGVSLAPEETYGACNLIVEPLLDPAESGLFIVAFQDAAVAIPAKTATRADGANDDAFQALAKDLQITRERLRVVTEELQSSNEELQSSNEEFVSVNEELQSTNEELETSKEELQSLNEELQTINAELNHRNESLVRSSSDLANLFDSTSIATLFVDSDLRIRRFTPRVQEIFKIRDGDEGRPITDIVSLLARDGLEADVRQVLHSLVPIEREVTIADGGAIYLKQVRPYRDLNNVINGAVVNFVDISERKKHELARSRLAAIVESSQDAIIGNDLEGIVTSWNAGAERLYGCSSADAMGQPIAVLLADALPDGWPSVLERLKHGERIAQYDSSSLAADGTPIEVSITFSPVREGDGRIVGASVVARDVSERRTADRKAALLLGELDHRVKNILAIVSAVVAQTLKTSPQPERFAKEIEGRIKAIAKAHSLLTESGQGEVSLRALVTTELAPYEHEDGNLVITGHDIWLTPKAGLSLAMAIHELASNAAKYGALSVPTGHLAVTWDVSGAPPSQLLELSWKETGGPTVQLPTRRGFGTTLIERALSYELDAKVSRAFLPEGHCCTISIPFTAEIGRRPGSLPPEGRRRNGQ